MKKYIIKFNHICESTYTAVIEAKSKEEAEEIFNEAPFDYLVNEEPEDEQALDIRIISIKKN